MGWCWTQGSERSFSAVTLGSTHCFPSRESRESGWKGLTAQFLSHVLSVITRVTCFGYRLLSAPAVCFAVNLCPGVQAGGGLCDVALSIH